MNPVKSRGHLYSFNCPLEHETTLYNLLLVFAFSVLSVLGDKEIHSHLIAPGIFDHVEM